MYGSGRDQRVAYIVEKEILELSDLSDASLIAAHAYWDKVRAGRAGPPVGEFRLEQLPPTIIPSTAVVDLLGPPLDFRYRFFGTRMVEIAGQELTGKRYLADGIKGFGFINWEIFPIMIERRAPIHSRTRWVSVKDFKFTTVTVRLPLSEDGETITGAAVVDRFIQDRD